MKQCNHAPFLYQRSTYKSEISLKNMCPHSKHKTLHYNLLTYTLTPPYKPAVFHICMLFFSSLLRAKKMLNVQVDFQIPKVNLQFCYWYHGKVLSNIQYSNYSKYPIYSATKLQSSRNEYQYTFLCMHYLLPLILEIRIISLKIKLDTRKNNT
jgi:hypothetical protein